MKDLFEIGSALQNPTFRQCALVTVIHVEGSAYRRAGSRMLIGSRGQTCGMISGGCLEHDVLNHARGAMRSQTSRIIRYDSTSADDLIFGTGLGCNGVIDVLVEPLTQNFREALIHTLDGVQQSRQNSGLATMVTGAADALACTHAFLLDSKWTGDEALISLLESQDLPNDQLFSETPQAPDARVFVQQLLPPIQLIIFGGWLDVVPVIQFAQQIGFQVSVVDSCRRPSSAKFFAQSHEVLLGSPAEAISRLPFDDRTVVLLMNHNFERDREALAALTELSVPYIGMLGPKRRQEKILQAIANDGILVSDEFIETLHGPVGLDLGAKTPDEIALAIVAEILASLNARDAKPIRDRTTPLPVSPPPLAYV